MSIDRSGDLFKFLINPESSKIFGDIGQESSAINELELDETADVLLYKLAGSVDHRNSCMITSEQHSLFVRDITRLKLVPNSVSSIINNCPAIFLGYALLDADFRLVRNTLYHREGYSNCLLYTSDAADE